MIKQRHFSLKKAKTRSGYIIMKMFFLFFSLSVSICLASNTYSQSTKLSINMKNVTVKQVLDEIEVMSEFIFFYQDAALDVYRKVSIDANKETVERILDQVLRGTDNTYFVSDRSIYILKENSSGKTDLIENLIAQQEKEIMVTGKVVDKQNDPLPGVTITVIGETRGVITDVNGLYSINVKPNDKLSFSFIGMETQIVVLDGKKIINITLNDKTTTLDEVTIVAYGEQKKESVIGSIASVSVDEIRMPAGKISTALAGQLAGVVSVQSSGEPGSSSNFWIRGVSTFGANNRPLILVDGIERDLDLVDTEDIASFSILKDATATAVYGVRGANGIVLITTKRGRESMKPQVNVKTEYGVSAPTRLPKLANGEQWIDYYNDINFDLSQSTPIPSWEKEKYIDQSDPDLYPNVDWLDLIFNKNTPNYKASINITGGGEKFKYYVSGNYYREGGMYKTFKNPEYDNDVNYNRFSFRSNVDVDITKSTLLTLNLANQFDTKNRLGTNHGDIWRGLVTTPPIFIAPVYSDGSLAQGRVGMNPYYSTNYTGYSRDTWFNTQALIGITQDFSDIITPGLKANAKFSWDAVSSNTIDQRRSPNAFLAIGRDPNGELIFNQTVEGSNYLTLARSNRGTKTINFETSVTYDNLFNDIHRIGAMFLFSLRQHQNDFPADYIAAIPYRNNGIASRLTYSYKDKYFTEFNFGYNGSENFSPKKRFGFFPSVAVGYLISNEKYFENLLPIIHLLKLKASYGIIGNDQIGGNRRFAFNSEMNGSAAGYPFGSSGQGTRTGISTGYPGNPDVAWEEAKKFNTGIEFGFFNSLKIVADYFFDRREGIYILQESVPSVVGINVQRYVNLGKMQNQGVDASLEYYKQVNKDLFISLRGNYTFNRNKKLYDDKPTPVWAYQEEINEPLNQQRGLIALGLFESEYELNNSPIQKFSNPRVGDIKYKDINGDGIIDQFDKVAIGRTTIPEMNYGFGASINWKGFDISIFFQGVTNVTRIIGGTSLYGATGNILAGGQIFADIADNRWSLHNTENAKYPRLSLTQNQNNSEPSTFWQRDMSFLRLKNAELGYTLPKNVSNRFGVSAIRFYALGVNLATISNFKLWDPELGTNNGSAYPLMKTVNFGLNINF